MRIRAAAAVVVGSALAIGATMARRGAPSPPAATETADAEVKRSARAFFGALNELRWQDAGTLLDPALAAGIRQQALNQLLDDAEKRHLGRRAPERPWLVPDSAAVALLRPYGSDLLRGHDQPLTVAEVAAAAPGDLVARFLSYRASSADDIPLSRLRYRFLGVAVESDTVAHVVYRAADPALHYIDPWRVELMPAYRRGGRWRFVPADHVLAGWDRYLMPATPETGAAQAGATPTPTPTPAPPAQAPGEVSAAWARAADGAGCAFINALQARRYESAAGEILPGDLDEERSYQLSALAQALYLRDHPATHSIMVPFPVLPPEELDPLLRRYAREPPGEWPRVHTVADLAALTPRQLVARELEAFADGEGAPAQAARFTCIGAVVENDSVAHLLYRTSPPAVDTLLHVAPSPAPAVGYDPGWVSTLELRSAVGRWYVRFESKLRISGMYVYGLQGHEHY